MESLFNEKVKKLAEKLLVVDGDQEREVRFEDFLWANSVFWTRALNIPFPRSYVFPRIEQEQGSSDDNDPGASTCQDSTDNLGRSGTENNHQMNDSAHKVPGVESTSQNEETLWVEGLVPGIDFCNHALKAAATWEVDESGSATGLPFSMYLLSAGNILSDGEKEITISYGNKGNEELLYLYGFVVKDNPDDYLMVHYPLEALSDMPFSEAKMQLLEGQKGELRCLLPRSLLKNGFFLESTLPEGTSKKDTGNQGFNYSWSGHRKMPSYTDKLIFPENFLTALRTITIKENEIYQVSSLLEELVGNEGERQPSETEVRAAVWEACGDSAAFQLLVDLLNMKMMELEEGTGTEQDDADLLEKAHICEIPDMAKRSFSNGSSHSASMSRNRRSSIIYRQGQKQLTRLFLKEAEHALQLALTEGN